MVNVKGERLTFSHPGRDTFVTASIFASPDSESVTTLTDVFFHTLRKSEIAELGTNYPPSNASVEYMSLSPFITWIAEIDNAHYFSTVSEDEDIVGVAMCFPSGSFMVRSK